MNLLSLLAFLCNNNYSSFMLLHALLPFFFVGVFQAPIVPSIPLNTLNALHIAPPNQIEAHLPVTSAMGVLVIDNATGQTVASKNGAVKMPMASITKLMTAMVIVEHHGLDEIVTIPAAVTAVPGQKAYLTPGDTFTVGELISAVLITSANDAAVTLAIYHSGTIDQFAIEMNTRAQALGLTGTSYANPTGFDHPMQYSTPKDIAALYRYVQAQPALLARMSMRDTSIVSLNGTKISLYHTHALMHREGGKVASFTVESGKTGTTSNAKQCVVSTVTMADRDYTVVVLNSQQRYTDLESILQSLSQPALALNTTSTNNQ
jgi:serine-type D-Ala-D-Ala carboxypeptidase (penicillin-binding protein 5/6)